MKKRIFYMDFVRAVATMIIIIFHFNISVLGRQISTFSIFNNNFANGNLAYIGVPMFFILSGAALMYSNSEFDIKKYIKKRLCATYPMFWLAYILVLFYYFFRYKTIHPFSRPNNPLLIILTILGLDGYTSNICMNYYLIGEWFLGCIILMYILFPILKYGMDKYPMLIWIPIICFYLVFTFYYPFKLIQSQNVLTRLPEFLIGMYIGKYLKKFDIKIFIVSFLVLLIMIFVPISFMPEMFKITIIGVASFLVFGFFGQQIKNENFFTRVCQWISKYSFAIYLLHHVISEQIISTYEGKVITSEETIVLFLLVVAIDFWMGYILFSLDKKIQRELMCNFRKEK